MVSISGVRGIIPDGLDLDSILMFSRAFENNTNGKSIVIGRDGRPSGSFIEMILSGVILAGNKSILSLGVVPTPTVKSAVKNSKSNAGVMISASHNPVEWNAFKLIGKNGFFYSQEQIDNLMNSVYKQSFKPANFSPIGTIESGNDFIELHLTEIMRRVDVSAIRKKKLKVLIDAVNCGGSYIGPLLLEKLGCKVIRLHCDSSGKFARPPEPTPASLQKTWKELKKSGADLGFALDPDADRLVILSPKYGPLSEELTLPLAMLSALTKAGKNPKVVVNLSTSMLNDYCVSQFGGSVIRAKVGEANVVAKMIQNRAVFGGEGNGGVIDPTISSFGRDALAGMAHILNLLAKEGSTIDSVRDRLPRLYMSKKSVPIGGKSKEEIFDGLLSEFKGFHADDFDGIRLSNDHSWVHVRFSNTEPIMRIIGEAGSEKDLQEMMERAGKKAI